MVTLTPEMAGNSFVVLGITYFILIGFQVYVLYLNWKQSKVKDDTKIANVLLADILKELRELRAGRRKK